MSQPYPFLYKSLPQIRQKAEQLGVALPLAEDTAVLNTPLSIGAVKLQNRMGIAPMEGVDSNPDGSPGELTFRRYLRFAAGGAGLIWFEAVSIVQEGRSSLKQLLLTKKTLPAFQRLNEQIKETGLRANGFAPYLVMQANHSGRYSRPNAAARPEPIVAFHNPYLERMHLLEERCVATDDYLKRLEETFGEAALLAKQAGFDAVDIKSCHGYLLAELTAAHTRPGPYGGSFENRTRLLVNAIRNAQQTEDSRFQVLARVGVYDNIPHPYGFGMHTDGGLTPDLSEPLRLMALLAGELHVPFVNITMGDPHYDAYITRPFHADVKFTANEDPLAGVARMLGAAKAIKAACPQLGVSASAPSYLRQFSPNLIAGAINEGWCDHACFGRLSFANPAFPKQILENGGLTVNQACVACSKCSELIRAGYDTGCVVRDYEVYLPVYRALQSGLPSPAAK